MEEFSLLISNLKKENKELKEENKLLREANITINENNQKLNKINRELTTMNKEIINKGKKIKDILMYINIKIKNIQNLLTGEKDKITNMTNLQKADRDYLYIDDLFKNLENDLKNEKNYFLKEIDEMNEQIEKIEKIRENEFNLNKNELNVLKNIIIQKSTEIQDLNKKLEYSFSLNNDFDNFVTVFQNILKNFKIDINLFQNKNLTESNDIKKITNQKMYEILNIINEILMDYSINKESFERFLLDTKKQFEFSEKLKNEINSLQNKFDEISNKCESQKLADLEKYKKLEDKYIHKKKLLKKAIKLIKESRMDNDNLKNKNLELEYNISFLSKTKSNLILSNLSQISNDEINSQITEEPYNNNTYNNTKISVPIYKKINKNINFQKNNNHSKKIPVTNTFPNNDSLMKNKINNDTY